MSAIMQKIGKIRKMSMKPYVDILTERLRDENKGYIRKYIRAKLKLYPEAKHGRHTTG
jgi:hypothetical protein